MLHRRLAFALILVSANLIAGQDAQKPAMPSPLISEERSTEFLIAVEKLRTLPRPGDIQNAGILANIADVIETTPEQKAAIVALVKAYEIETAQRLAKIEAEMKTLRAETEAKIIAILPEARRSASKKVLDYSHEQWMTPFNFEAQLRADFLARKEKANDKTASNEELDAARKEFMSWLRTQRQKAREKNAEVVTNLGTMLDPKEAERLSDFDKNKEVPETPKKR